MKTIQWTEEERDIIKAYGEVPYEVAEKAMERSGFNFDDVERINEHYEEHRWGSDADRRYRNRAVRQAVQKVAANAAQYI